MDEIDRVLLERFRALNEREQEVLRELGCGLWCRPLDVGGRSRSHHSATLQKLAEKGLCARRFRGSGGPGRIGKWDRTGHRRGSFVYRITLDGMRIAHAALVERMAQPLSFVGRMRTQAQCDRVEYNRKATVERSAAILEALAHSPQPEGVAVS